jgi:carboxyl-terminal processing protease
MKKIPSRERVIASVRRIQSYILTVVVTATLFGIGGYTLGEKKSPASAVAGADLAPFWKAWQILDSQYFGGTDKAKEVSGAISGLVGSVNDPYTVYLPPSQNSVFQADLQGSFGGIGAELAVKNSQLTIMSVLSATPAEKAGLKAQDVIVKIDGKAVATQSFTDAIAAIRGSVGSVVTLNIARADVEAPFDVKVTRDTITVKSVTTATIGANSDVAYIKVAQFGADTAAAFKGALKDVVASGKKGAVIDLRDNPGGYVQAVEEMIGMVIPATVQSDQKNLKDRIAVVIHNKNGSQDREAAGSDVVAGTLPLTVLVNGGSASASEIFSGAMKDYKRATVIGTKTFGKGSEQDLLDLGNGGTIKVTIAKWFTPLGTGIDGTGLQPDVTLALPTDVTASTSDIQVQKALEFLK